MLAYKNMKFMKLKYEAKIDSYQNQHRDQSHVTCF